MGNPQGPMGGFGPLISLCFSIRRRSFRGKNGSGFFLGLSKNGWKVCAKNVLNGVFSKQEPHSQMACDIQLLGGGEPYVFPAQNMEMGVHFLKGFL